MGPAVYILGFLTTLACGVLLMRGYFRSRRGLLLWSGLCFLGLAVSNFLLFLDLVLLPNVDLYLWRLGTAAIAMLLLMYGLIWEGE
ncbi:MAG TPA: DUF5985 family protein [Candidatus Acidoferrales bacterium]|nr:DUF5985 family protein [Candidatus Acidoferrales bacterium]